MILTFINKNIRYGNCEAPKSGGLLINHQLADNLWISHNSIPHRMSHSPGPIILQNRTEPPCVLGALPNNHLAQNAVQQEKQHLAAVMGLPRRSTPSSR